jgi:uncharacterized protein (DUF4415 family)
MKASVKSKEEMTLPDDVDFSKGIRGRFYRPHKVSTTIRVDDDVLLLFKKLATKRKAPYQTLMNEALREYAEKSA